MMFWWNEANVSDLKRYNAEGLSCAQIGNRLGVSRNAVIGKLARLGIPKLVASKGGAPRHFAPRKPSPPRKKGERPLPMLIVPALALELPALRDDAGNLTTLMSAHIGQCRFIYGDGIGEHCCAHSTIHGTSWCDYHFNIVFKVGLLAHREALAAAAEQRAAA